VGKKRRGGEREKTRQLERWTGQCKEVGRAWRRNGSFEKEMCPRIQLVRVGYRSLDAPVVCGAGERRW